MAEITQNIISHFSWAISLVDIKNEFLKGAETSGVISRIDPWRARIY